jgi:hypothetical protein
MVAKVAMVAMVTSAVVQFITAGKCERETERETLNKSFDRLRTNVKLLIPFVVSLSNHERNRLIQRFQRTEKE